MSVVVDASVALDWIFDSERTPWANRVLEAVALEGGSVPAIFPYEVANGLLVGVRTGRFEKDDMPRALALLERLDLVAPGTDVAEEARRMILSGFTTGLTAYDAAYLELALRESLPIATHDADLRRAATKAGVPLFEGRESL